MRCHKVILTISLSVGFLDSLHDPSAYAAPHDISDAAVPVNEHSLQTCKPCCDWSEPISQKLAHISESELAFWKACTYDHSLLGKPAHF